MTRQSFQFLTGSTVRLEFHVREDQTGVTVESLYNPPRDPDQATFASAEEAADAIEAKVSEHLTEHRATLMQIKIRHDLQPLTYAHLGRFAVPLVPQE